MAANQATDSKKALGLTAAMLEACCAESTVIRVVTRGKEIRPYSVIN